MEGTGRAPLPSWDQEFGDAESAREEGKAGGLWI